LPELNTLFKIGEGREYKAALGTLDLACLGQGAVALERKIRAATVANIGEFYHSNAVSSE
jgi:hypothetical protein